MWRVKWVWKVHIDSKKTVMKIHKYTLTIKYKITRIIRKKLMLWKYEAILIIYYTTMKNWRFLKDWVKSKNKMTEECTNALTNNIQEKNALLTSLT